MGDTEIHLRNGQQRKAGTVFLQSAVRQRWQTAQRGPMAPGKKGVKASGAPESAPAVSQ